MKMRRFVLASVLALLITIGAAPAAIAGETDRARAEMSRTETVSEVLADWADAGVSESTGTWSSAGGRRLQAAIAASSTARTTVPVRTRAAAQLVPCQGRFDNEASFATLQQSPTLGIPWRVDLKPLNAALGVVNFSAQIFADGNQANVYRPHIEPWNYSFHGPLPRTFQRIGGGTYTMRPGSEVSFLWFWHSAAQPAQGGYGFVNCAFSG